MEKWLDFGAAGLIASVMFALLVLFSKFYSAQLKEQQSAHDRDTDRLIAAHEAASLRIATAIDKLAASQTEHGERVSRACESLNTEVKQVRAAVLEHAARDEADHRDLRATIGLKS